MSLTVDELAKEIGRIYEGDDAWCRMVATGLLPFIDRHIAAAAQSPGDSLSLHGTAGRSVSRAAECPCKLATCVEPWEPGCGLGTSAAHVSVAEPKPAGAVPLPEPSFTMRWTGREQGKDRYWSTQVAAGEFPIEFPVYAVDKVREYGDAREAAGRAVAEGYVLVSRALLEQIYGMAREGCDAPSAAYRWCERIDEVFHAGDPSQEYADWEQDLPAAMIAAPIPQQPAAEGAAVNQSLTTAGAEAVYQYQTVTNGWHDLLDAADSEKYKAAGWPVRTLYTHPTPAADAGGVTIDDLAMEWLEKARDVERKTSAEDQRVANWPIAYAVMQTLKSCAAELRRLTPEVRHA